METANSGILKVKVQRDLGLVQVHQEWDDAESVLNLELGDLPGLIGLLTRALKTEKDTD